MFPFLIGRIRTGRVQYCDVVTFLLFPFLIGRIRTLEDDPTFLVLASFPFLIGRIRTNLTLVNNTFVSLFPFLIGRIRTFFGWVFLVLGIRFHSS